MDSSSRFGSRGRSRSGSGSRASARVALAALALCLAGLGAGAGIGIGTEARAQDSGDSGAPLTIENVRVGFEEKVKIGAWNPFQATLRGGRERFEGRLEVVVPDDDESPTIMTRDFELAAGEVRSIAMTVRPGNPQADYRVRVYRRGDSRPLRLPVPTESLARVESLTPNQVFVGTLGRPRGIEAVRRLPEFPGGDASVISPASNAIQDAIVVVPIRLPDGAPPTSLGYDALDALVLDAEDPAAMAAYRSAEGAIREWVLGGGKLVVAVGMNWAEVRDSTLVSEGLLPAIPTGTIAIADFGALEDTVRVGTGQSLLPVGGRPAQVAKLEIRPGRFARALDPTAAGPLIVRGAYGFGEVTAIALSVSREPFASWKGHAPFWYAALGLRRPTVPLETGSAIISYQSLDFSRVLRGTLDQFPGVRLVPFGWVAFLIFVYLLLIGPGDYLFLRKALKRMEWTWVTFPAIVLGVSLFAYYFAYSIKGTNLRVNKIDVVDVDAATGDARGVSWFNVFSPENEDYTVDLTPLPLRTAAEPSEAVARRSPEDRAAAGGPAGGDRALSWFGAAESGYGGMNNPNRIAFASTSYGYLPAGSGEARGLERVRVAMWSTKCLFGRWTRNLGERLVDSDLRDDGNGRLIGTITNLSERDLESPALFHLDNVYVLETIPAGGTLTINPLDTPRTLGGYLDELYAKQESFHRTMSFGGTGRPSGDLSEARRQLMTHLMFFNGLTDTAKSKTNGSLRFLDLSGQADLGRPMLVAGAAGPAARLELWNEGPPPEVEQTTVLRICLPLEGAGAR